MVELTAPIALKDDMKRIVYGPVLIPDEPDSDGDVVKAERIETVAHDFVENYGNVDLQHSLNNVGALVESYILPMDLPVDNQQVIPKGSWMLGARVTNNDAWDAVKSGKLSGFSIMAIQHTTMAGKSAEKSAQRTTLADLGDDWKVNAVSLVDEPAVPRAKFLAIKSADDNTYGISLSKLENMLPAQKEELDVDEETLRRIIGEMLAPLEQRVSELEPGSSENSQNEPQGDDAQKNEQTPGEGGGDATGGNSGASEGEQGQSNTSTEQQSQQQGTDETSGEEQPQGETPALSQEQMDQLAQLLSTLNGDQQQPQSEGEPAAAKSKSNKLQGQDSNDDGAQKAHTLDDGRDAFGRKRRAAAN